MELVEGPTLADRIAQGAAALDEALPIAAQISPARSDTGKYSSKRPAQCATRLWIQ